MNDVNFYIYMRIAFIYSINIAEFMEQVTHFY